MKVFVSLLLCLLLLFCLCGCDPQSEEAPTAQVVSPIRSVSGSADFANDLKLYLPVPENADNPSYCIISDQIAQIQYTYNGRDFTLRCAESTEDISGVYGPFIPYDSIGVLIDHHSGEYTVRTKYPTDGGGLALWQIENYSFSLYTPDEIEVTTFDDYAASIALTHLNHRHVTD